jgi:3-phosphoinositide dependent protein kinase-1
MDLPETKNLKKCDSCQKELTEALKCGACGTAYYCSLDCQKANWKVHKTVCSFKPSPKTEPTEEKKSDSLKEAEERQKIDDYTLLRKCGTGNFSEIWEAKSKVDQNTYAVKIIQKQRVQSLHKEKDVLMEKHALKQLEGSDYVIKLYDTFKDDLNLYFVMEYAEGGELWNQLKSFGLVAGSLVKYYFTHLVKAVHFIHSKGIVHRDLKPENVLLDKANRLKLVDFGTSRDMLNPQIKGSGNSSKGKRVFDHFIGTPQYMAPENVRNKDSGYKCDIWSLACILYQFIAGCPPYNGASEYIIFTKSVEKNPVFYDYLFSGPSKDLLSKMLIKDFEKRPTLEEVMKDPYFEGVDWNNLPAFEDAVKGILPHEQFLIEAKAPFFTLKEDDKPEFNELALKTIHKDIEEKLKANTELLPEDKELINKRLGLMLKQSMAFYSVEDFEWEGLPKGLEKIPVPNDNLAEKDQSSDEDE